MRKYDSNLTIRLQKSTKEKLNEMCTTTGLTQSQLIIEFIESQYDKMKNNPELKKMLETLKNIQDNLNSFDVFQK